jgi:hypothetical protein
MNKKVKILGGIFVLAVMVVAALNMNIVFNDGHDLGLNLENMEAVASFELPGDGYSEAVEILCDDNVTTTSECQESDDPNISCIYAADDCPEVSVCERYGHNLYSTFCFEYCTRCDYTRSLCDD